MESSYIPIAINKKEVDIHNNSEANRQVDEVMQLTHQRLMQAWDFYEVYEIFSDDNDFRYFSQKILKEKKMELIRLFVIHRYYEGEDYIYATKTFQ